MGTFPSFPEAQQMAKHLATQAQDVLVGLGMDKTQAVVSHQPPCQFVVQFIPGPWLVTVPTESQAVPSAQSWHSRAPPALLTTG